LKFFTPENGKAIQAAEENARESDAMISGMLGF
jgi:hypothetical protein